MITKPVRSRFPSKPFRVLIVVAVAALVVPVTSASAQFISTSSIDGTVNDETGGALPGVAVTVSSPSLQVAQLEALTDAEGRYRFPQLPAGVYQLRFELSGFQTVIRESLQLGVGFAARIDMSMKIGSLTETVTVSGASPVVDLTTTTGGQLLTAEVVNRVIPTSRQVSDILRLAPGVKSTLPPQFGMLGISTLGGVESYGTGETKYMVDGVDVANSYIDANTAVEVDVRSFGNAPDIDQAGVAMNVVTKSGGNETHGSVSELFMHKNVQSDNINDFMRAQGLSFGDALQYFSDAGVDLGGRLIRDKLWFYGAFRDRRTARTVVGFAANAGSDGKYGTSDDPPYYPSQTSTNYTTKLTYQVTPTVQLINFFSKDKHIIDAVLGAIPERANRFNPREAVQDETYAPTEFRGEIRATPRNNLLMNVQWGRVFYFIEYFPNPQYEHLTRRFDRETQIYTGSPSFLRRPNDTYQTQGNLTYLPQDLFGGGHEFRFGYRYLHHRYGTGQANLESGNYLLIYDRVGGRSGQPVEIRVGNEPVEPMNRSHRFAVHGNDRWELSRRVTANLGLRYEHSHGYVPEQIKRHGQFLADVDTLLPRFDANTWNSLAPRLGVAWDLTGEGKTVVKSTFGMFYSTIAASDVQRYNSNSYTQITFRWRDLDGNSDYTPGIGEVNLDPNGPDYLSLTGGGATNNIYNPDYAPPRQREITASLDRELMANMAGRVVWVYKKDIGASTVVNILRPYSAYNIPLKRRDPGPDGNLNTADDGGIVTIWDYDAAYRGAAFVGNFQTNRPDDRADAYHTLEFILNKRTTGRWGAVTSVGITKNHRWLVGIPTSPNDDYFPVDKTWEWVFKGNASYILPYEIQIGGLFEYQPGLYGQRTHIFRAADPDGGPALRQQSTVTLRLEPFGAQQATARHHSHMRVAKLLRFRSNRRLSLHIDAFNVFNSNSVWENTYLSGTTFGYVRRIISPRVLQFGFAYDF